MEKKYKLTEESINVDDRTLYRIEALINFDDVEKGDKGGFIEKEENLSQSDICWVYDDAKVYGNAVVCDNAEVYGDGLVYNNAEIYGDREVHGNEKVGE